MIPATETWALRDFSTIKTFVHRTYRLGDSMVSRTAWWMFRMKRRIMLPGLKTSSNDASFFMVGVAIVVFGSRNDLRGNAMTAHDWVHAV